MGLSGNHRVDVERTRDQGAAYVQAVADETFPILLSGDHYITYPSFAGVTNRVEGDIGLIHLDAHSDTMSDEKLYGPYWHGSPMARIDEIDQGGYERSDFHGVNARPGRSQ